MTFVKNHFKKKIKWECHNVNLQRDSTHKYSKREIK